MDQATQMADKFGEASLAFARGLMSIWLPIQLASIALVAVLSAVVAMQIRNRIDTPVQTRSWPPLLRLFEFSVHTAIFVLRREVAVTLTLAISQFSNGPVTRLAASF